MADVLSSLPAESNCNLLIGFKNADDAGIYRINERQALVQTVDFFPPIVDDPYGFGQIAAANALSDIYAMGGTPLTALNIVGFPPEMPRVILQQILHGSSDKIHEAGAVIVGGHSIKDNELKYGVACTGIIDIDKIVSNAGAEAGDRLFLTKSLGTGIITTAIKQKMASDEDVEGVTAQMSRLNKEASDLMLKYGAHAATDVTGYGILGHAFEMAHASNVSIEITYRNLPVLHNVLKFAEAGALTGGAQANRDYLADKVEITSSLSKVQTEILYDAQTSGGLLISIGEESVEPFLKEADSLKLKVTHIGRVLKAGEHPILVV